jgi:hypothetical protein
MSTPKSYKTIHGWAAIEGLWSIERDSIIYSGSEGISAGIGGSDEAYIVEEFDPRSGRRRLEGAGRAANLNVNTPYLVEVGLEGQRIRLIVDQIKVLEHVLSSPLEREQVGLFASGPDPVSFHQAVFQPNRRRPLSLYNSPTRSTSYTKT